jgi:hypothetical protein
MPRTTLKGRVQNRSSAPKQTNGSSWPQYRGQAANTYHWFYPILTPLLSWVSAYSTSCFSGFVPSALAQTMLRMTSGSPTPNDQRMPKCSAT